MNYPTFTSFPSMAPPNPSCSILFGGYTFECQPESKPSGRSRSHAPAPLPKVIKTNERPQPVPPNAPRLPIYTIPFPLSPISLAHEKTHPAISIFPTR